jgi:hypothetical protein
MVISLECRALSHKIAKTPNFGDSLLRYPVNAGSKKIPRW